MGTELKIGCSVDSGQRTEHVTQDSTKTREVSWVRRVGIFPIRMYQVTLAWFLGGHCRFTPSCSVYGLEAIQEHGVIKGWWMAVCRICRCHPFCKGGHDPVPPAKKK